MKNVLKINGVKIEKGLCSSLVCRLKIHSLDKYIKDENIGGSLRITHAKIWELINQYGIAETVKNALDNVVVIETPELTYYIDLN